jgi:hypothetical protein
LRDERRDAEISEAKQEKIRTIPFFFLGCSLRDLRVSAFNFIVVYCTIAAEIFSEKQETT